MAPNEIARPGQGQTVEVCGLDLELRTVELQDQTPTGTQIALAAGFNPEPNVCVLQWLDRGVEDISPTEVARLKEGQNRFIVCESDGLERLTVDGLRYDWPVPTVSVTTLRKLAHLPRSKSFYLEHERQEDRLLEDDEIVRLGEAGVEQLFTRWVLKIGDSFFGFRTPTVKVRDALTVAGINLDAGWQIFLKVKDQPKQTMELDDVIDLTTPGIEKLRVSPKEVNNGEGVHPLRQFRLLDGDERHLDTHYPGWVAVLEGSARWVILLKYQLPEGFSPAVVQMALNIPPTYPMSEVDMFYLFPAASLNSGVTIPATEAQISVQGLTFQRWSRHRGSASQWRPGVDSMVTHLALVEAALLNEVQK
ncbi:multiubiquitin domain-containing protein [Acidovorax radicis]|uniref:multiubiquitin domain-containing protein n=1 Tax=Acidovorax radicis TaxID=758826 RepID=UPI001CF9294B|nr:multiubiquitin domain-containing protein [Acidovorax radicis]UCU99247.1 multiubiquitin domain-containing protein [Acidovorax radicis]